MPKLILGSSSPYRAAALETLGVAFDQLSPDIDETPRPGEAPADLASRLAVSKAECLAAQHGDAIIIGSDQVGWCQNRLLNKPATPDAARQMLHHNSGQIAWFYTALAVCSRDPQGALHTQVDVITTELKFRDLSTAEVDFYIAQDQPLDAAGSFKAEGLGIALFEYIRADDPSALIGLPLITLTHRLRQLGINPLSR